MRIRSALSHMAQVVAEGSLVALLIVGLVAGTALAAKPAARSGSGTISVVVMDGATDAQFAGRVTFDVSTTATDYPYVHLMCYQSGALVAEGRQGFFPTALGNEWFTLGPTPAWQSGAADCTANLEKWTKRGWSVLGATSFHVYQ